MGAVRIGRFGRRVFVGTAQAIRLDPRPSREVGERERAVGAGDPHGAVGDLEVAGARLQRVGGELLEIVGELARRAADRGAAARDRARSAGADAGRDQIGVALDHAHALRRQVEMLGDELRIGGVMALPGRLRADQHRDDAVRVEPHDRGLRAVVAARLDVGREADAAQLAGFFDCAAAALEAGPVADLLRARHVAGELAGIVDLAGRRRVRHRLRLDEVALAQRVRRDAELARRGVDQPLDHIGRLGPPGAAIGIDRHRVGVGRRGCGCGRSGTS